MDSKYDKKRVTIAIVILAIIVIAMILMWPYYEQRKYTGKQVELPSGLTVVGTIESCPDYYFKD